MCFISSLLENGVGVIVKRLKFIMSMEMFHVYIQPNLIPRFKLKGYMMVILERFVV